LVRLVGCLTNYNIAGEAEVPAIDWNISVDAEGDFSAIEVEAVGTDAPIPEISEHTPSRCQHWETLLENAALRNIFVSDLLEVL